MEGDELGLQLDRAVVPAGVDGRATGEHGLEHRGRLEADDDVGVGDEPPRVGLLGDEGHALARPRRHVGQHAAHLLAPVGLLGMGLDRDVPALLRQPPQLALGLLVQAAPDVHLARERLGVGVQVVGEEQEPPLTARRGRRRVEVEARLPGHRDEVGVGARPHPVLAMALAAHRHVVAGERRVVADEDRLLLHGPLGHRRLLLHHDERNAEALARGLGHAHVGEDVRRRDEHVEGPLGVELLEDALEVALVGPPAGLALGSRVVLEAQVVGVGDDLEHLVAQALVAHHARLDRPLAGFDRRLQPVDVLLGEVLEE